MGSPLFGGAQKQTSTNDPWAAQTPYIKDAFSEAQGLYKSQSNTPWYQGDLYARMNGNTTDGLNATVDYANGTGAQGAGALSAAGSSMLPQAASNWGTTAGLYATAAQSDPTQANIKNAGLYADNPYMSGQIDAASRDISRNLSENIMPSIDRAATASGNVNSTRAGVAEGIAQRGAQDQIGDIASTMRGNAYQQGLGLSEQARGTNLDALGASAGLYGTMFGAGAGAITSGQNAAYQNLENQVNAGKMFQTDEQGALDADYQKWLGNDTRQASLLDQYYKIIGANNWGGTNTTTAQNNPGLIAGLMGAASSAAGTYASATTPVKGR